MKSKLRFAVSVIAVTVLLNLGACAANLSPSVDLLR
jgi:hypothetical protein